MAIHAGVATARVVVCASCLDATTTTPLDRPPLVPTDFVVIHVNGAQTALCPTCCARLVESLAIARKASLAWRPIARAAQAKEDR